MKYIVSITALAAFCVMLGTSCSKDTNNYYDGDDDDNERIAIRLSSNVQLGNLRLQDNQIVQGQNLSFFVTREGTVESVVYDNELIIADGEGGFASDAPMYYPADGSNVDFYALHPYSQNTSLEGENSFSIVPDQSEQRGYLNSDLLYATHFDVERTRSAVTLDFTHKLAKLDFVIIQGGGAEISLLDSVTILNALPTTTIDLEDGSLGDATGTPVEVITYGINRNISGDTPQISGITAIIVPQTMQPGRLFRIRLGNIDYYYNSPIARVFEEGKRYTLQLTINQAEIELESSIADWTSGGTIEGDGNIE